MKGERPADLTASQEWLRQRRVAPEQVAPCFARWLERFLGMHEQRPQDVWQDTLEALMEDRV